MPEPLDIVAIGAVVDIAKVRVALYQDGRLVHAPFPVAGSSGDMAKSVYDSDDDGKVDTAASADTAGAVPWSGVTGAPSTFPPTLPIAQSEVTNLVADLALKAPIASPAFTGIVATAGQIAFPATDNPSSNANTLDDYEEGTWTPTFTFATPGNLSIVYSTRVGTYAKIGKTVIAHFTVITSTFTHTTASGVASIGALPFSMGSSGHFAIGPLQWQGIAKASYTSWVPQLVSATSFEFRASGSGMAVTSLATTDMPTAGTVRFVGSVLYEV